MRSWKIQVYLLFLGILSGCWGEISQKEEFHARTPTLIKGFLSIGSDSHKLALEPTCSPETITTALRIAVVGTDDGPAFKSRGAALVVPRGASAQSTKASALAAATREKRESYSQQLSSQPSAQRSTSCCKPQNESGKNESQKPTITRPPAAPTSR
jgi:hypothetical protein